MDWKELLSTLNSNTKMSSFQSAKIEWEENSEPRFVPRRKGSAAWIEEFRQRGIAKAWLEWNDTDGRVEIKKIEAVPQGNGDGTRLLEFLKRLAIPYDPNPTNGKECPSPADWIAKQERLVEWYRRCGFQIQRSENGPPEVYYPRVPRPNEDGKQS
jgi:GNAT superfamily N-acetyltransferase